MNKDLIKCCATILVVILLALVLITACSGCAQTTPGFEELDGFIDNPVEWVETNDDDFMFELTGCHDTTWGEWGFSDTIVDEKGREIYNPTLTAAGNAFESYFPAPYMYGLYDLGVMDGYYGYYGIYVIKFSAVENEDGTIDCVCDKCFVGVYDGETTYGRYYDINVEDGYDWSIAKGEDVTFGSGKDVPDDALRVWYYYFETVLN